MKRHQLSLVVVLKKTSWTKDGSRNFETYSTFLNEFYTVILFEMTENEPTKVIRQDWRFQYLLFLSIGIW